MKLIDPILMMIGLFELTETYEEVEYYIGSDSITELDPDSDDIGTIDLLRLRA
jgi:hypothetical protein